MKLLQPPEWARPTGYSNGIAAKGTLVFVAGQVGWNANKVFESTDFVAQAEQALRNIVAVLSQAQATPENLVRMTWYVVDKDEYNARQKELGAVYRKVIGRVFPAMSCVQVAGLVEEGARLEIEATAVIPD
jgi:enamine deaminase RidA (YjgF/YER057c/UK114 family)